MAGGFVGAALAAQGLLRRRPVDDEEDAARTADFRPGRDSEAAQPRTGDYVPGRDDASARAIPMARQPQYAIKDAAIGYDSQINARPLSPAQQVKAAAGGSPRYVAPPAPSLDLSSASEVMPRPELSDRHDDLTAGADGMRPPNDPTNLRDPLSVAAPSYERYARERDALPTEREYMDKRRPIGVKQRILSSLKLGGKFLALGGPAAAVTGLAIGGLDKDSNARFDYRTQVEPHSIQRQKQYMGQAQDEQGLEDRRQTGIIRQRNLQREEDLYGYETGRGRELNENLKLSQTEENRAQADRARREPLVRQTPIFGPGHRTIYNPVTGGMDPVPGAEPKTEKTPSETAFDKQAESDVSSTEDFSGERPRRMQDLRSAYEQRYGITPDVYAAAASGGSHAPAARESIARMENQLGEDVDRAMKSEHNTRVARRRNEIVRQSPRGAARTTTPGRSAAPADPAAKMKEHEARYQASYANATPEARAAFEKAFEERYGRRPQPPTGH